MEVTEIAAPGARVGRGMIWQTVLTGCSVSQLMEVAFWGLVMIVDVSS